jgi:type IV pilus assembly protein PilB
MSPRAPFSSRYMTSVLLESGTVTEQQIEQAVLRQRETGRRIGETLIEMGVVTEEDIAWALSRQLGHTYVDVTPEALDRDLVREFSEDTLRRLCVVPLVRDERSLTVAFADPLDDDCLAELERGARMQITVCVATPAAVRAGLDAVFGARIAGPSAQDAPAEADGLYDILWERSGITFVLFHVSTALKRGVPELHFLPAGGQLQVYYREGRRLVLAASEPAPVLDCLLTRLESLGMPSLGDRGHVRSLLRCPLHEGFAVLDVSMLRGSQGIAVTLAPRAEVDQAPRLDALGMDPADEVALRSLLAAQAGLVLVCGPPGSGAALTLSALVDAAGLRETRILVFEPEPRAPLPGATRVHLPAPQARATWEEAVVAQRGDVVLLDDVLRGEAIASVLAPAGSGRLILAATDWLDSFALLSHLASTPRSRAAVAERLLAVIQQRALPATEVQEGRAAAAPPMLFEVLAASPPLRQAIRDHATAEGLREVATDAGFRSLASRAHDRVVAGTLSRAAAARALS